MRLTQWMAMPSQVGASSVRPSRYGWPAEPKSLAADVVMFGKTAGVDEDPEQYIPFVKRAMELTRWGAVQWKPDPSHPERMMAIDPKLVRPDGSGQHYAYYFSLPPEEPSGILIKGVLQRDEEGHRVTREGMGETLHDALLSLIIRRR